MKKDNSDNVYRFKKHRPDDLETEALLRAKKLEGKNAPGLTRHHQVGLKATPEELEDLKRKSAENRIPMVDLIWQAIKNSPEFDKDEPEVEQCIAQWQADNGVTRITAVRQMLKALAYKMKMEQRR